MLFLVDHMSHGNQRMANFWVHLAVKCRSSNETVTGSAKGVVQLLLFLF